MKSSCSAFGAVGLSAKQSGPETLLASAFRRSERFAAGYHLGQFRWLKRVTNSSAAECCSQKCASPILEETSRVA